MLYNNNMHKIFIHTFHVPKPNVGIVNPLLNLILGTCTIFNRLLKVTQLYSTTNTLECF